MENRCKLYRTKQGLTQDRLAMMAGVSRGTISRAERGLRIRRSHQYLILVVLHVIPADAMARRVELEWYLKVGKDTACDRNPPPCHHCDSRNCDGDCPNAVQPSRRRRPYTRRARPSKQTKRNVLSRNFKSVGSG